MWKIVKRYVLPNLTGLLVLSLLLAGAAGAGPLRQVWQSSPTIQSTSTTTFSYQGRLADAAGSPITDNAVMEFKLYDVPTGGVPLWSEVHNGANSIPVSDGLFHALLGSIEPIPLDIISGDLYLGISVNGDAEMEPRELLASVPYAMVAGTVEGSVGSQQVNLTRGSVQCTEETTINENVPYILPGTTSALDIPFDSTLFIIATFDFYLTSGIAVGEIYIDDAPLEQQVLGGPYGGDGYWRGTVSESFLVDLPAGTHTIDLRARTSSSLRVYNTHTGYTYLIFSND